MHLKIAHLGVMMKLMVDSPSDQISLVRFLARPSHTIMHQPSASCITDEVSISVEIAHSTPSITCCIL